MPDTWALQACVCVMSSNTAHVKLRCQLSESGQDSLEIIQWNESPMVDKTCQI